ncbi:MAG: hypothetical protein Q9M27_00600 [Mariprofundaceae bacterium]|nr:hypothetical protein [Mariprofundaceae bacterium]
MNSMAQGWIFILVGLPLAALGAWMLYRLDKTPGYHDKSVGSFSRAWRYLPRNLMMTILGIGLLCAGIFGAGIGFVLLTG